MLIPHPSPQLKYGVFTPELLIDMVAYGVLMAVCVLGSFTVVLFGFFDGELGRECNATYPADGSCEAVFRARATCYTTMTWIFLFFAWELIDFRQSFFDIHKRGGFRAWAAHLWGNQFLFLSITVVFFTIFATLYIPVLDHVVFMHHGISWEWAVVFIAVIIFFIGAEAWKWLKRAYFRRKETRQPKDLC